MTTTALINPSDIANNFLPELVGDGKKNRYLSFRVCGYSVRESCNMIHVSQRQVMNWRKADPEFREIDLSGMSGLRRLLSRNYLRFEWVRNYRMALMKDAEILHKSLQKPYLDNGKPNPDYKEMTQREHQYLEKARSHYTSQQLETLERLLGDAPQTGITFNTLIMKLSEVGDGHIP